MFKSVESDPRFSEMPLCNDFTWHESLPRLSLSKFAQLEPILRRGVPGYAFELRGDPRFFGSFRRFQILVH